MLLLEIPYGETWIRFLSKREDNEMLNILSLFFQDKKMAQNMCENIDETNGESVCYVIDGLDEFPLRENKKSIIHKIIHKEYLQESMVIVASRPVATKNLRQLANTRVET